MNRREFIGALSVGAAGFAVHCRATEKSAMSPICGCVYGPERKMSGVIVSDGLQCVRTDADGKFELPRRAGARFLTVTPPSGFRATFHFLPIPRLYEPYYFSLVHQPSSAGSGCRFVHVADGEMSYAGPVEKAWIERVRGISEEVDAAFVVHTGDICRHLGMVQQIRLMNETTMGRPTVYCIGNHDLEAGPTGENEFEVLYGPCWYSFEAGGVHFCVTPMPHGDFCPSYTMDDVADWLRNDLALLPKGQPVVLFGHMISNYDGSVLEMGVTLGKERKIDLRKVCNFKGFIFGHLHYNRFVRRDGVSFVCTATPDKGGIDLSPESVRILSVDENGNLSSELRYGHVGLGHFNIERSDADWETDLGAQVFYGEPLVADGRVFVGAGDDEGRGTGCVAALDAKTGLIVWRRSLPAAVKGRMVLLCGNVIAQDSDGGVRAFRQTDGAQIWEIPAATHPWRTISSGLAADEHNAVVFAGCQKSLSAIDANIGKVLWRDGKWTGRDPEACANAPGYGEGVVVMGGHWSGLYANDARTGRLLWKLESNVGRFTGATPVIRDGRVLTLGYRSFAEISLKDGSVLREVPTDANVQVTTKVVEADGLYLFGTAGRGLLALNRQTLKVVWTGKTGDSLAVFAAYSRPPEMCVGTVPVVIGNRVVATSTDGAVHIWNLKDGRSLREIKTGVPYLAGVAVSRGQIFAADLNGHVRMFAM